VATETIEIPHRFNGPLESGNGGYGCGLVAAFVEGPAEVNLRRPVPLDTPLEIRREDDGSVLALDGENLVVEGHQAPKLELAAPAPVSLAEARAAHGRHRAPAPRAFSRCFVCGGEREDSLGVRPGAVEGRDLVATPWTPPEWTAGEEGTVRPEIVWAVLDCPTYFGAYLGAPDPLPPAFLARFAVRIDGPVRAGEEYVVIGWPIEVDGRKVHAGSAVLSGEGEPMAVARALMIEARSD
jgi:hypothetical protein